MKQVYSNLKFTTGAQVAGICSVKIIPKEWMATQTMRFADGTVAELTPIQEKDFLVLNFTDDSYQYDEKPKSNKSGTYYEVSCGGTLNDLTPETQQILESLKNHEFICLVKDRKRQEKLVGDTTAGMRLQMNYKQGNNGGGTEVLTIDLAMECEDRPPYYKP